jgi:hypothetical protein
MRNTARQTPENRTITIDFQNERRTFSSFPHYRGYPNWLSGATNP